MKSAMKVSRRLRHAGATLGLVLLSGCSGCDSGSVKMCVGMGGVPAAKNCCSGGQAINPPPSQCPQPPGFTMNASLSAASESIEAAGFALNQLDAMAGNRGAVEHGGTQLAATAVTGEGPFDKPKQADPKDSLELTNDQTGGAGGGGTAQAASAGPGRAKIGLGGGSNTEDKSSSGKSVSLAAIDGNSTPYTGGGGGSASDRKSGQKGGLFGFLGGSDTTAASAQPEVGFGADRSPASAEPIKVSDPDDYFARIDRFADLFKVVERRYRKTSTHWAISDAQAAARH